MTLHWRNDIRGAMPRFFNSLRYRGEVPKTVTLRIDESSFFEEITGVIKYLVSCASSSSIVGLGWKGDPSYRSIEALQERVRRFTTHITQDVSSRCQKGRDLYQSTYSCVLENNIASSYIVLQRHVCFYLQRDALG